ncbi:hypothetical protein AVEN_271995-1 [Araneus ventricosus]|uniref:Uncharacterized protein n=1 Tax=Araneus ventricosus TaxID=182803 RepID=A0A4Y2CBV8_ARAVE|nr:hypothetical protein AVEN_271995-1 [Araneus ventricosus]
MYRFPHVLSQSRGGLVIRSNLRGRRVSGSKPDSSENPPCMWLLQVALYVEGQTSSRWRDAEAWRRGMPAQVLNSTSKRGSKLRGPSQDKLRTSSKGDVNVTKMKEN